MTVTTTTHLNFRGDARKALEFYQSVFGGELTALTYEQMQAIGDPAEAGQIMWGQVAAPNGFAVMAFDVPSARPFERGENAVFVSVRCDNADELEGIWERLSEGADIAVPLAPARWSPLYGMLKDRFGIVWVLDMIAVAGAH